MRPEEGVPALDTLMEQFMDGAPVCYLCKAAPGIMPWVYVADLTCAGHVEGFALGLCMVCACTEGFEGHLAAAIREDERRREGALWN